MHIPIQPPPLQDLIKELVDSSESGQARIFDLLLSNVGPVQSGRYRHWDKLRHLVPPEGLTHREWWLAIKFARNTMYRELPILDKAGSPFKYAMVDPLLAMLRVIDTQATGAIQGESQIVQPQERATYIMRSLIEEAITSSQLEGASTTRKVAKAMIQTGREPRSKSEKMIMNNYDAMLFIRSMKKESLTPEMIFELHKILTDGTLEHSDQAGRIRTEEEYIHIVDESGKTLHMPPLHTDLRDRLQTMCDFANQPSSAFIHPVVKSILLHFWLAYDHPFVDGNGRTARAIFYWSMAHEKYWLCEFISISRILRRAPGQYARSFLYTETDGNDATYFILAQLHTIIKAIEGLHEYLVMKTNELNETREMIQNSHSLHSFMNHRQLAVLNHALNNPAHIYTIESHRVSHNVSYLTARSDLLELAKQQLLDKRKVGKRLEFVSPKDLKARLDQLNNA